MHPTSRQLLSWEWYCYPIPLIHFESLDAHLLPHRRSLKAQALLRGIPLAVCLLILPITSVWSVFKCLGWHSRKTELVSHVTASPQSGLHGSFEGLVCKVESNNLGAFLYPVAHSVQDGRCFAWHGKHDLAVITVDGLYRRRKDTFCNVHSSIARQGTAFDRGFVYSTHL